MAEGAKTLSRDGSGRDVTLPVHCPACNGKLSVTFEANVGPHRAPNVRAMYTCPHCRKKVDIMLPGLLVPPVQIRYE